MQRLIPAATTALRLRRGNPPPGLFSPTQSYFELLGPMDSRNGRGSVDIQNWMTDLNLCRMSSGSWNFFFYGGLASELV